MERDKKEWWKFPLETDLQCAEAECEDNVWSDVGRVSIFLNNNSTIFSKTDENTTFNYFL